MWARVRAFLGWAMLPLTLVQLAWSLPLRDEQTLALWEISPYFIQVFWITCVFISAAWVVWKNRGGIMFRLSKRRQFMALSADLRYLSDNGRGTPGLLFIDKWLLPPGQRERALVYDATLSRLRGLGIPTPSDKAQMGVWAQYFQYLMLLSERGLYDEAKNLDIPTLHTEPVVLDDGRLRKP